MVALSLGCAGDVSPNPDGGKNGDTRISLQDSGRDETQPPLQDSGSPGTDLIAPADTSSLSPDSAPWPHDIGTSCTGNGDCMFGLCVQNTHTGSWFCSKQCDPCATEPCPSGSGCQDAGLMFICAPGYPNAPC